MRKIVTPISVFLLSGVAAIGIAAPACAQAAPADETATESTEGGLSEIIVQARKVDENLQEVPVAVTVLSGEELDKKSVIRVQDIAAFTPGMYMRSGANSPAGILVSLRGQAQNDTLITLDPSVGTYVDGVYWARAYGLNANLLDINSVQVLKGPQGTLFGRNTTGGAILINSNDPQLGKFSGKLSTSYGRFNEYEPTAVVNIPLGEKIAIRLAGKRFSRDGYTTNSVPATAASIVPLGTAVVERQPRTGNLNGIKADDRDRWQARAKVLVQATDNFSVLLSGEYFKLDEVAPSRNLAYVTGSFSGANSTYNTANTAARFAGLANGASAVTAPAVGLGILNTEIARLANGGRITANNEVPYVYAKTQTYNATGRLDTGWGKQSLSSATVRSIPSRVSTSKGPPFRFTSLRASSQ
ncbi:TonB-dependent receptor plug domain-containing protein [Novosphingobium sp. Gsoil 351]|uniref:TonB-dependent receptor plug domain-containing protein n=1 Tax=Novosphingobium sp. Gsoil 351 TaxID=2675225 RepID=UPI0012B47872|nr:TonB-dependent receptor plug domain-containing protein [Novosphingobium sp. Gsoil 351]QGN54193.1 TonB-dependent receptor plug domain-containing protein [Novosphingobium sp. Gsoil 351]